MQEVSSPTSKMVDNLLVRSGLGGGMGSPKTGFSEGMPPLRNPVWHPEIQIEPFARQFSEVAAVEQVWEQERLEQLQRQQPSQPPAQRIRQVPQHAFHAERHPSHLNITSIRLNITVTQFNVTHFDLSAFHSSLGKLQLLGEWGATQLQSLMGMGTVFSHKHSLAQQARAAHVAFQPEEGHERLLDEARRQEQEKQSDGHGCKYTCSRTHVGNTCKCKRYRVVNVMTRAGLERFRPFCRR